METKTTPETITKTCIQCGRKTEVLKGAVDFLSPFLLGELRKQFGDRGPLADIVPAICDVCDAKQKTEAVAAVVEERRLRELETAAGANRLAANLPKTVPFDEMGRGFEMFMFGEFPKPGLYIHGKSGTRKTTRAVNFARAWLKTGQAALYLSEVQLMNRLKDWRKIPGGGCVADREREAIERVPLLILDDFGTEKHNKLSGRETYGWVDARYQDWNLRTVIISNMSLEELEADQDLPHIDARICRRIRDICRIVNLDEQQRRERKNAKGAA